MDRIQQRRDTKARWEQFNPILLEGEIGYVLDDPNLYKIGDGIHNWNDLKYRGYDGTLVQTIEDGDQSAVVSQWGNYQSDRHLQLGKASLMDVFGIDNLLTQAEIWTGYSTAENPSASGEAYWEPADGQCGAILKISPGDVLVFQGWIPKYGFFSFAADDGNNFIARCTQEVIPDTSCFKITVPSSSNITRICFTLYRDNNISNSEQTAFNPQTALVTKYDKSVTYPIQRIIKPSLVTPIIDESLKQVKADPEYFSKTDGQSNLLQKGYSQVFGFENKLTQIIKGFQYSEDNEKVIDENAAISNDISINGECILVVQGFYPKWGYYLTLLDEGHEIIITNYSTGIHYFGSMELGTYGIYINIPAVYNEKNVAYIGLTLWRENNGDTNGLPFDANFAFAGIFSEVPEVPLFNKLRSELTFSKTQDYRNILNSITTDNISNSSLEPAQYHIPGFISSDGSINTSLGNLYHDVYILEKGKEYILVRSEIKGAALYFINYYNENGIFLGGQEYLTENIQHVASNIKLVVPDKAFICKINTGTGDSVLREYKVDYISVPRLKEDIDKHLSEFIKTEQLSIENGNGFCDNNGEIKTNYPGYYWKKFNIDVTKRYSVSVSRLSGSAISLLVYFNSDNEVVGNQYPITGDTLSLTDAEVNAPIDAEFVIVNYQSSVNSLDISFNEVTLKYISVSQLKEDVNELSRNIQQGKLTSILKEGSDIYIRSKFSDSMDMVIHYSVNTRNMNFSPKEAYLGYNTLTTKEIAETDYVHYTWDSTSPFFLQNYWYLFGEHGYFIPQITSEGHDKDTLDIGSWWKTADNKEFQLISISGNILTFAPKITKNGSGEGRDSRSFTYGDSLSGSLTWLSGGVHDTDITITESSSVQWLPFEYNVTKKYFIDDIEITKDGEYYGKEVKVVDIHEGLNPITITQWNPIKGDAMVRISFTHRFFGLTVFVSNTIEVLYPMWLNYYGAFQPLGLRGSTRNDKEYHAMIVIPKVKEAMAADKITVDWTKPQDCTTPNQNWAKIRFGVNSTDLLDTNNIPERIVEWQQVPDFEDYLIGFAAGYSIISGLTVNEKRKDLVDTAFQFTQDERNKLYIRCVDGTKFPNEVLPAGWIGNFNYYYSYFNPSENETKVYWYKEGGEYIIYIHAFDEFTITKINLPEFMDGYVVQRVIESTEGSKLLTDTVSGGSLYATFPEGSNYLVFTLK